MAAAVSAFLLAISSARQARYLGKKDSSGRLNLLIFLVTDRNSSSSYLLENQPKINDDYKLADEDDVLATDQEQAKAFLSPFQFIIVAFYGIFQGQIA